MLFVSTVYNAHKGDAKNTGEGDRNFDQWETRCEVGDFTLNGRSYGL